MCLVSVVTGDICSCLSREGVTAFSHVMHGRRKAVCVRARARESDR